MTELLRTGAEPLIYRAVQAEFLELLAEHSERRTEDGKAGVVRKVICQCAEKRWRRLRGFDYLAKVIIGIKFKDGVEVTAVDQVTA